MSDVREVRVRPRYAELYPDLPADAWVPARTFAELMVRRASTARSLGIHRRTLDPRHFEFRGGAAESRPRNARTRRTDPSGQETT